jgi:hypothetical protein
MLLAGTPIFPRIGCYRSSNAPGVLNEASLCS